jgi:hypothetical protein
MSILGLVVIALGFWLGWRTNPGARPSFRNFRKGPELPQGMEAKGLFFLGMMLVAAGGLILLLSLTSRP